MLVFQKNLNLSKEAKKSKIYINISLVYDFMRARISKKL